MGKGFALLAGKNAEELWPALNVIMLTWVLLALAPRYKHTPTLTLVAPVVVATLYTVFVDDVRTSWVAAILVCRKDSGTAGREWWCECSDTGWWCGGKETLVVLTIIMNI